MHIKPTTLREIINSTISKFNNLKERSSLFENQGCNLEKLANEFQIYSSLWDNSGRMKTYQPRVHYCTDTYVGMLIYVLDGIVVAVSYQNARKSEEMIEFISDETAKITRDYLLSLTEEESKTYTVMKDGELDEEINGFYQIMYASQILHKYAIYRDELGTHHVVKIEDRSDYYRKDNKFKDKFYEVEISFIKNPKNKLIINVDDLKFLYGQLLDEIPNLDEILTN